MSAESRPKSTIERVLSPIAEVHRSEAVSALLMTLLMFLLLAAYYLLKTVREVFILTEGGAEIKSYSSAGQATLLVLCGAWLAVVGLLSATPAEKPVPVTPAVR